MNKVSRIKNKNFTTISNVFLRDKNLSIKSKGFLAVVMGLPDDWEFSINGICSILKEGKTAIYNTIDELKQLSYCKVVTNRDTQGRIIGNDYMFFEEPQQDKQYLDEPYMENPNMANQPQLNKEIIKNSIKKNKEEVYKTWRNDFETYLQIVYEAQAKLLNDIEFKKQKELYHENLDYELSLEKMVKEYWATDAGWGQKKKNKQTKNIDMVATLKKAFDYSCNRVYKKINTRQKQNVVEPTKTPDNPFYTVVPLNSKLKFIDKRGTLNDGTFVEDGYRYYLSQKDGMKYSIPPKAEPMPHQDCEYDMKSNKWYEPKQVQNSDGLFLF